jgi:large subunit ribosomal protein L3
MTQLFNPDGSQTAVTVISLESNIITQVKTDAKDGYAAIQVGVLPKKLKNCRKPEAGNMKKLGMDHGFYAYREFRLGKSAKLDGVSAGQSLEVTLKEGDLVDLTSISKGKGFQGGMKRYHMGGLPRSHGVSVSHRSVGSIGNRADPGKCFKNKKMAGQMGNAQVTVQNVRVMKVDLENGILLVHGSVPGPKTALVTVRKARKKL